MADEKEGEILLFEGSWMGIDASSLFLQGGGLGKQWSGKALVEILSNKLHLLYIYDFPLKYEGIMFTCSS